MPVFVAFTGAFLDGATVFLVDGATEGEKDGSIVEGKLVGALVARV